MYADLLKLHGQGERLSDWLSDAAYRIRQLKETVSTLSKAEFAAQFRPELHPIVTEAKAQQHRSPRKLIQVAPPGLFDIMRIKGPG